jgi:transcriptional antiterminator RfaH
MPILKNETSIYPSDLFEDGLSKDETRNWFVLHTKTRQEKAVARCLVQAEIPFYLPLMPHVNLIRNRKHTSHIPLFSGYVFVLGRQDDLATCHQTNRLTNVLRVLDGKELWCDLRRVRVLIESGAPLTPEQRIQPNQRVRVKSGSFQGIEGIVLHRRNKLRIVVLVNFLQQGVSMEVEDWMLESIA